MCGSGPERFTSYSFTIRHLTEDAQSWFLGGSKELSRDFIRTFRASTFGTGNNLSEWSHNQELRMSMSLDRYL